MIETVSAVQVTPGAPLEVTSLTLPDPADDQVLVKVLSSGVCHSQLHQMENAALKRPLLLGHE